MKKQSATKRETTTEAEDIDYAYPKNYEDNFGEEFKAKDLAVTRFRDNFLDPQLHPKPWIAPGKHPDYCYKYSDSGLAFQKILIKKGQDNLGEKDKTYIEKYVVDEQVDKKFRDVYRDFQEYKTIGEGEVIITIEYCTNCKQHQNTTRHDEKKYYDNAVQLKNNILKQFPFSKIYLKPVIYDLTDRSPESLFMQKRIGAFEVQICSKSDGKIKKAVLFSKLKTRQWPNHSIVIDKISKYTQTCSIGIELQLQDDDNEMMDEKEIEEKLGGIQILLKPKRDFERPESGKTIADFEYTKTMQQQSNVKSRPISGISRPKSAFSNVSFRTMKSINKKIPDKNYQQYINNKSEYKRPLFPMTSKTNQLGKAAFTEIPFDIYTIIVEKTNNFYRYQDDINIFERIENNLPLQIVIQLEKQTIGYLNLQLMDGDPNKNTPLVNAQIEVMPYDEENLNLRSTQMKENLQQMGKYWITLDPGKYKLHFQMDDYQPEDLPILVKSGENNLKHYLTRVPYDRVTQAQKSQQTYEQSQKQYPSAIKPAQSRQLEIFLTDAITGEPLVEACIQIFDNELPDEPLLEELTDESGTATIQLSHLTEGKIVIQKEQYFEIVELYGKMKMDLTSVNQLSFPMIQKPPSGDEFYLLVLTMLKLKSPTLKIICPDNNTVTETQGSIEVINKFEDNYGMIKIKQLSGSLSYQIYITKINKEFIEFMLKFNKQNNFQNYKVFTYTNESCHLIEIPQIQNAEEMKFWDIGFLYAPNKQFIEINSFTSEQLMRDSFLPELQELINFINNSKLDLKTFLGFINILLLSFQGFNSKDKIEINNDLFISQEKLMKSIDKYGYEGENVFHLLASALHINGMYSWSKLESKFQKFNHLKTFPAFSESPSASAVHNLQQQQQQQQQQQKSEKQDFNDFAGDY